MSDPNNTTISPQAARSSGARPAAKTHVGKVTETLRAIPTERATKKILRTLFGAGLVYAALRLAPVLKAAGIWRAQEVATGALILGAVMFSFEFFVVPLNYLVAIAKDVANLVIRVLNRKQSNGTGAP